MDELVSLKSNKAVCDSVQIAERFHKRHSDVIRAITNFITQNCVVKSMFRKVKYVSENGQTYDRYDIDRDGFSLLVMSFNGKEALDWKLKYIDAFNKMEKFILERQSVEWQATRSQGKLTRHSMLSWKVTANEIIKRYIEVIGHFT